MKHWTPNSSSSPPSPPKVSRSPSVTSSSSCSSCSPSTASSSFSSLFLSSSGRCSSITLLTLSSCHFTPPLFSCSAVLSVKLKSSAPPPPKSTAEPVSPPVDVSGRKDLIGRQGSQAELPPSPRSVADLVQDTRPGIFHNIGPNLDNVSKQAHIFALEKPYPSIENAFILSAKTPGGR